MAGDGAYFIYEDEDLQELLKGSVKRIEDLSPAMKAFSEYMVKQTDDRFDMEQAPDGSAWQQLSPVTSARKAKANKIDKILQQDGFLRLVHPHSTKDSSGVYSNRIYAAIHNEGGWAGRGNNVEIPQREFLGFSEEDIQEFIETTKDYIVMARSPS